MSNKISTKSYTIKRLRDCGYAVDKLDTIEYSPQDQRKWSIIVDNGVASIIVTYTKDDKIQFYDGDRFLKTNLRLDTDSAEVIVEFLNKRGIVNKHTSYGKNVN